MAWQQSAWKSGPQSSWKEYSARGYSSSQQSWKKGHEKMYLPTSSQDVRWESKTYRSCKQLCRSYGFDRSEHSKIKNERRKEQDAEGEYERWQQEQQYEYDAKKSQGEIEQPGKKDTEEGPSMWKDHLTAQNGSVREEENNDRGSCRAENRSRSRSILTYSRSPSYSIRGRGHSDSRTPQRTRSMTPNRKTDAAEKAKDEFPAFKCHDCYDGPKPQGNENYLRSILADIKNRQIPQEMLIQMLSDFGFLPSAQKITSPLSCEPKRASEISITRQDGQAKKVSESPAKGPRNSHSHGESPKRKRSKKRKQKSRSRTRDEDHGNEKEQKKKKKKRRKAA